MSALTAIELGADSCVLVKAAVRGAEVRVGEVEMLDPAAFPGPDGFATALRHLRRKHGLPRRARVVLWGVPEGASSRDPAVAPLVAPLKKAGFHIDRLVSPCNALAALARVRQPRHDSAIAWLAVNRSGVAIAVVRPGEQLFAHSFNWDSSIGATGSQARMLQRYSLVAFLAPELRRGIEAARAKDCRVDAIITCGNLPDLRSLTMPLIEELDVEVETLDSLDGLTVKPTLKDALAESAPAIRIACAGAVARASRGKAGFPERFSGGALFRAAALVIAVAGVGWLWMSARGAPPKSSAPPPKGAVVAQAQPAPSAPPAPAASAPKTTPPATPAPPPAAPPKTPTTTAPKTTPTATPAPQKTAPPPAPVKTMPRAPAPRQTTPAAPAAAKPSSPPRPLPAAPASRPAPVSQTKPAPQAPAIVASPAPPQPAPVRPTAARTDKLGASPAKAEPLTDPLPRVTTIFVSAERRFAMLEGGRVVSLGDTIGQRVVAGIEPRALVLKEPSGVQIRVGLGGRLLGVDKRH